MKKVTLSGINVVDVDPWRAWERLQAVFAKAKLSTQGVPEISRAETWDDLMSHFE